MIGVVMFPSRFRAEAGLTKLLHQDLSYHTVQPGNVSTGVAPHYRSHNC